MDYKDNFFTIVKLELDDNRHIVGGKIIYPETPFGKPLPILSAKQAQEAYCMAEQTFDILHNGSSKQKPFVLTNNLRPNSPEITTHDFFHEVKRKMQWHLENFVKTSRLPYVAVMYDQKPVFVFEDPKPKKKRGRPRL